MTDKHTALNERLKKAFPCSEADLEANRAGQLSVMQQDLMQINHQSLGVMGWGCGMVVFFILCLVGITALFDPKQTAYGMGCVFVIVPAAVMVVLVLGLGFSRTHIIVDLETNSVVARQGTVKCKIFHPRMLNGRRSRRRSYALVVGEKQINVPHHIFQAFVDGETYSLYFIQPSGRLIAAEHIPTDAMRK